MTLCKGRGRGAPTALLALMSMLALSINFLGASFFIARISGGPDETRLRLDPPRTAQSANLATRTALIITHQAHCESWCTAHPLPESVKCSIPPCSKCQSCSSITQSAESITPATTQAPSALPAAPPPGTALCVVTRTRDERGKLAEFVEHYMLEGSTDPILQCTSSCHQCVL